MRSNLKHIFILSSLLILSSCGGGGGGGGGAVAQALAAVINSFTTSVNSSLVGGAVDISWSSSNASECEAGGSWTGTKTASGTETVTISATGVNQFTLTCKGEGGNATRNLDVEGYRNIAGISVDGYVTGATIFIDKNENITLDSDEDSTTSDNTGAFTIKHSNGALISKGGMDLDTQTQIDGLLMAAPLSGYSSDNFSITPVTTIGYLLPESNIYNLLGIDSSINVYSFDPVANKGDGGVNDYLYEKGNQLTILALALYNVSRDLDPSNAPSNTSNAFTSIAQEIQKLNTASSAAVDIESELFIKNVLDNMIADNSLTISDASKANTLKALSTVMPLVQVKSSDDITTAIVRFGISTMQTDIVLIANGTADSVLIDNYDTNIISYVASDQSIDSKDIVAGLISFNDSIQLDEDTSKVFNPVANDSLASSDSYSLSVSTPSNGSASISASNQITYTPNTDYNGTDTFSYTVTQGADSSTSDVTVTVNSINDLPVINIASTLSANENQTTVSNIGTSDVDVGDSLQLTLGGTDASSFSLSSTNDLTFVSAPDYETKSSYSLTFSLTDGTETVTKTVTINVINLNDVVPVISSTTTYAIDENLKAIGTIEVTDPEGGTFTYTTGGTDGTSISISSAGVMSFVNAPDYETKSSYSFTVTVSDGVNSSSKTFTITINDLEEIPTKGYEVATSISIIDTKE